MSRSERIACNVALLLMAAPLPVLAQVWPGTALRVQDPAVQKDPVQDAAPASVPSRYGPTAQGRPASSAVGEVGRRQTGEQAAAGLLLPTARLAGRIQNRVQSRLRNRIDRTYDPTDNATRPFEAAETLQQSPQKTPRH